MSYVIYNKANNNKIVEITRWKRSYKSLAAAKAAVTRASKQYFNLAGENYSIQEDPQFLYGIAESGYYSSNLEKMVEKVNLMTGKKYMESANTPYYCSPSSETYWSA